MLTANSGDLGISTLRAVLLSHKSENGIKDTAHSLQGVLDYNIKIR